MTQQQILELIKWFSGLIGAMSIMIVAIVNTRAHLDKRVQENSAGATKLLELVKRDKEIEDRLDALRDEFHKDGEQKNSQIKELAKEIRDFTFNALKLFQNTQK